MHARLHSLSGRHALMDDPNDTSAWQFTKDLTPLYWGHKGTHISWFTCTLDLKTMTWGSGSARVSVRPRVLAKKSRPGLGKSGDPKLPEFEILMGCSPCVSDVFVVGSLKVPPFRESPRL